jgi:hypothetical protein
MSYHLTPRCLLATNAPPSEAKQILSGVTANNLVDHLCPKKREQLSLSSELTMGLTSCSSFFGNDLEPSSFGVLIGRTNPTPIYDGTTSHIDSKRSYNIHVSTLEVTKHDTPIQPTTRKSNSTGREKETLTPPPAHPAPPLPNTLHTRWRAGDRTAKYFFQLRLSAVRVSQQWYRATATTRGLRRLDLHTTTATPTVPTITAMETTRHTTTPVLDPPLTLPRMAASTRSELMGVEISQ